MSTTITTTFTGAASLALFHVPFGASATAVRVNGSPATFTLDANGSVTISSPSVGPSDVIDVDTSSVALIGPQRVSANGGPSVSPVSKGADFTLAVTDDGATFYCTSTLTVTIPAGLSPMPQVVILPPPSGSVTLHPAAGVLLSGVTADQAFTYATNQTGVALTPEYGTADSYGLGGANQTWSTLLGQPTDNAALVTLLAGKKSIRPVPNRQTNAYTLQASDNDGVLFLTAAATDRVLQLPASLSAGTRFSFWAILQNFTAAAGRWQIAGSGGAVLKAGANASGGTGGAPPGWAAIGLAANNLVTGSVWLGVTGINNVAAVYVEADGTTGQWNVVPVFGQVNAT